MFTILGADGKEYGPVTAGKITEWIAGGRANLQTRARRAGETEWRTLGDFPEFNPAPPSLVAPEAAPPVAPTSPFLATQPVAPVTTGTLEPASRWLRLAAHIIDSLIGGLFLSPGFVLMVMAGVLTDPDAPNPVMMMAAFGALAIGGLLLLGIQIYLLTTRGQTMGKMAVGVKIVNFDDEQNPGFVKAFLLRLFVNGLIGAVPFLGLIYSIVDICFIFRDDRRCVHDLLAGTKVVKV